MSGRYLRLHRAFTRVFHGSARRGGSKEPEWGTEVNEPGGRLFGEKILKPGERRKLYDWEVPFIGTLVVAAIMLGVGLNSRPNTSAVTWAREEALARERARLNDSSD